MRDQVELDRVYERFQLIVNGPALFHSIVSALDLDVFGFLSRNPDSTFDDLLPFVGIAPHKLRILLHALCTTELVRKHGGRYANSAVAEDLLATESPTSWRITLLGWRRFQYPAFLELTSALRTGTNAALSAYPGDEPTLYERLAHDPDAEKDYHESIDPFTHLYMSALLDNEELGTVHNLLDVGGGDGTTAVAFARRYPDARVTVFDLPSVATLGRTIVPSDVADRVDFSAGDFLTDQLPRGHDAVLFSHVLEPFSPEQDRRMLTRAYEALPPGGKLFAYGTTAPDDESGGPLAARLSLFLNVLATGHGMAYPVKDYATWLADLGCATVRTYRDLPYEHGLAVGVKG